MKLSVITINYNNAAGLRKTVESVERQTCRDAIEYIIIDGASSDGSVDVIKSSASKATKWVSEPDAGIYNAMNKGVARACGEYCLFMNSGDSFHSPDVLQKALPLLDGTEFVIGRYMFIDSGELTGIEEPLTMLRLYRDSLPHQASFIRRDLLVAEPYDESLKVIADWKFFLKKLIIENLPYKFADLVVADYDCHGVSSTNVELCEKERAQVYAELLPQRVMTDYLQFVKGSSYSDTPYDKFFVGLRDYKMTSRFIYRLDYIIVKAISLFKKRLRFIRNLPF